MKCLPLLLGSVSSVLTSATHQVSYVLKPFYVHVSEYEYRLWVFNFYTKIIILHIGLNPAFFT